MERGIKALKESIEKWQEYQDWLEKNKGKNCDKIRGIVTIDDISKNHGSLDCPLCNLFIKRTCIDCPIAIFTHETGCEKTPYLKFYFYETDMVNNTLIAKHKAMLDFMKELYTELTKGGHNGDNR